MLPVATIDLDSLTWNYRFLCERAAPARVGAAVKANAYGLGLAAVSSALARAGCDLFFTAHFCEAVALRDVLPDAEIVILHGIDAADFKEAAARRLTPTLNHLPALAAWNRFAKTQSQALPAFIHLDTAMNRLGLSPDEQAQLADDPALLDGIEVRAWMSHFACADEFDNPLTSVQREAFVAITQKLPPAPKCLCNSSGIFWGAEYLLDAVRPGLALYGGNPTPHLPNPMRGVLTLRAPILQVREVSVGMTVGYGATHRIERAGRIATLALGYADGYHRTLSNKGLLKIGKHDVPLVGRISMDLTTLDVTDVPEEQAQVGAMVTLIGPHRPIDAAAQDAGTIAYEILTSLGPRIRREYEGGGA